ncbi:MAG: GNAT family protein [Nanoarchaeota archaeon]
MKNKIMIRKAKPGDEIGIAEMRKIGLKKGNWGYTGSNKVPNKKKLNEWRKGFNKNSESFSFVAIDKSNNKIVGSTTSSFKKSGRLRHRINMGWGIHPDYQKMGIGTKLLQESLKYAKKIGFKKAEAEMAIENKGSWKLALKNGFKIEGRKEKALLTDDNRYIDTYIVGRIL